MITPKKWQPSLDHSRRTARPPSHSIPRLRLSISPNTIVRIPSMPNVKREKCPRIILHLEPPRSSYLPLPHRLDIHLHVASNAWQVLICRIPCIYKPLCTRSGPYETLGIYSAVYWEKATIIPCAFQSCDILKQLCLEASDCPKIWRMSKFAKHFFYK
ncbi:hypothetical protein BDZ94DRAFT_682749 [Collybia nuda]|uniref:Uncharacterized protein n=1 Tax=Collybia nuda TaxID=64659 RepID=A0A9P5YGR6_9AGAR|nr:hypothetical protein BDZ94DRAFT_682749 [Collybia nuda]